MTKRAEELAEKMYVVYTSGDGSYESDVVIGLKNARRKFVEHMWFGPYEEGCADEMISAYLKEFDDQENNWCFGKWEWTGEQCSGFVAEITNRPAAQKDALNSEVVEALQDMILQEKGLDNSWCGMWSTCTSCARNYAKGGNWTVNHQEEVEGKCHICRGKEVLEKLNKSRGL